MLGGSFNPPHIAHLIVAELAREQFELDQILWIPNNQSPFKQQSDLAPAKDRLEMTRLAIDGNESFHLSEIEVRRAGVSFTIDTLRHLRADMPDAEFRLIIGSDSLAGFSGWRDPGEIMAIARPIVYPRPSSIGSHAERKYRDQVDLMEAPLLAISSSSIRERIRAGRTVRYMVPESVFAYMTEKELYR